MKMKRKELLGILETIDPIRAQNSISPPLMQYWFLGDRVMASNDFVTVSVVFKTPFECPAPGQLLALLKASTASDISLELVNDDEKQPVGLELALGPRAKSVIPLLEQAQFIDTYKKPKGIPVAFLKKRLPMSPGGLISAIKQCMRSVSLDSSHPDTLGVTLIGAKDQIELYSTNDKVLTASIVSCAKANFERAVLPSMFCQQLIRLAEAEVSKFEKDKVPDDLVTFVVDDSRATALIGHDITLQCKLIIVDRPTPYQAIFSDFLTEEAEDNQVTLKEEVLGELGEAVAQSMVIAGSGTEEVWSLLSVKGGTLLLETNHAKLGELSTEVTIGKKHKDIAKVKVGAKWLRHGLDTGCDCITITKKGVVMRAAHETDLLIAAAS